MPAPAQRQFRKDEHDEQEMQRPEAPLPGEPLERLIGEADRVRRVARIVHGAAFAHCSRHTASPVAVELEPLHGTGHRPRIGRT